MITQAEAVQRVTKGAFVGFRTTEHQAEKLNTLAEQTGLSLSGVLRALVEAADTEPVQRIVPVIRVAGPEQREAVQR